MRSQAVSLIPQILQYCLIATPTGSFIKPLRWYRKETLMKTKRNPVFVVNRKGKPLDPTYRYGHVRKLLKAKKAVPISNTPFTIRLKYDTPDMVKGLYAGIDTGRENIGLAASMENGQCVYLSDVKTSNKSVKSQMADRAGFRRGRRRYDRQRGQRKAIHDNTVIRKGEDDTVRTKHACRSVKITYPGADNPVTHKVIRGKEGKFNNRKRPEGWITPSGRQLVQVTVQSVKNMMKIMPLKELHVERVSFDFQKLENEDIRAWEYGKGILYGFKDYKEYIFSAQHGRCLLCGAPIGEYHHINPQKDNKYDHVGNIAGLCKACHYDCHCDEETQARLREEKAGAIQEYQIGLLNSVMPVLIEELDRLCTEKDIRLAVTEGKDTQAARDLYGIPKEHCLDAYAVSLSDREGITGISAPEKVYQQRRFKKKSKNLISKLNKREYLYGGKTVAVGRHKAEDQKEDSLEEYMASYAGCHSDVECARHFHELEIRPAKRTYTFRKKGLKLAARPGDLVSYTKKNKIKGNTKHKIVVAESVKYDPEGGHVCYAGSKSFKGIYCIPVGSGCVQYTGSEALDKVIADAKKQDNRRKKNSKKAV